MPLTEGGPVNYCARHLFKQHEGRRGLLGNVVRQESPNRNAQTDSIPFRETPCISPLGFRSVSLQLLMTSEEHELTPHPPFSISHACSCAGLTVAACVSPSGTRSISNTKGSQKPELGFPQDHLGGGIARKEVLTAAVTDTGERPALFAHTQTTLVPADTPPPLRLYMCSSPTHVWSPELSL
ncbi:hypothetical protein Q8A73_008666 [Channa argus]|nr:hypothetical protein Q8A73_008666 [Channa argus]